jgi:RNA polymerase sigma-70 factor (ECF subfamily)
MQPCLPSASVDAHPIDTATGTVNEEQLERLLTEMHRLARLFARRLVRPQDADDLAQDVVLTCLVSIREGRWNGHIARLPVIVAHLVRCRAVDRRRQSQRGAQRESDFGREVLEASRSWMAPDVSMEERELEEVRVEALEQLSPACRAAYELVREEGFTYREVAQLLGLSRGGVNQLVVRAQQRLRKQLKRRGIAVAARRRRESAGERRDGVEVDLPYLAAAPHRMLVSREIGATSARSAR